MPPTAQEIKVRLDNAVDQDGNVICVYYFLLPRRFSSVFKRKFVFLILVFSIAGAQHGRRSGDCDHS